MWLTASKSMTFEIASLLHSEGMGWLHNLAYQNCGMGPVIHINSYFCIWALDNCIKL